MTNMVLFKEDFARLGATIQTNTTNPSFLRIARHFHRMGLDNFAFPLALMNKDLEGHDPHNLKDPSLELRALITVEASYNYWYFIREVCRVPAGGVDGVQFEASRSNIAMAWCFFNHVPFIATQPRQTGKSVGALCITAHTMWLNGLNLNIGLYAHTSDLVLENVKRMKIIRDNLPDYMTCPNSKDVENKEGLVYRYLNNEYKTAVSQKEEIGANNVYRGQTLTIFHGDEPAFAFRAKTSIPAIRNTMIKAIEWAKKFDQPYGEILTTTAASVDTESGAFMFRMINDAFQFTEKMYDVKDAEALDQLLDQNSANKMVAATFSYLMLGKTHAWYHDLVRKSSATKERNDQDFLNSWKAGSANGLVPSDVLELMRTKLSEPLYNQIIRGYVISWYEQRHVVETSEFKHRKFVLGMDSSQNVGRDFTALVLIDITDMSVVATFRCNDTFTTKLSLFIVEVLLMLPNAVFIPENKSTGSTVIETVILELTKRQINPFRRIYSKVIQERDTAEFRDIDINDLTQLQKGAIRKLMGFMTTGTTRDYLYKNTLIPAATMNATRIYDRTLIDEMAALTTKNGRIDHLSGKHDDTVVAYLLTCWFLFSGKNLHEYGIDPSEVLSAINFANNDKIDPRVRAEQLALRKMIREYEILAHTSESPLTKQIYLQQIEQLKDRIDDSIVLEAISATKVAHDTQVYGRVYSDSPLMDTMNDQVVVRNTLDALRSLASLGRKELV